MNRRTAALALFAVVAALAAPLTANAASPKLTYHANVDGLASTLSLAFEAEQVSGELIEGQLRLAVRGTARANRLAAQLIQPHTGLPVATLEGRIDGSGIDALLRAAPVMGGAQRTVRFTPAGLSRPEAAVADEPVMVRTAGSATAGSVDSRLVGRWVNEKMTNSSGGGNFASFSTVRTLQMDADGRISQWVTSVGGGGNWNYDGGRKVEFSGRWYSRDGVIYVKSDAGGDFQAATRYRFSDRYLVTEDGRQKLIWRR